MSAVLRPIPLCVTTLRHTFVKMRLPHLRAPSNCFPPRRLRRTATTLRTFSKMRLPSPVCVTKLRLSPITRSTLIIYPCSNLQSAFVLLRHAHPEDASPPDKLIADSR
jgi:hypothetical protein